MNGLKITTLFLTILALVACNYNNAAESSELGFPQEENPALTEFMRHQIFGYEEIALFQEKQTYYYSIRNFNSDEDTISYFNHNESQLRDYYEPIFHSENHSTLDFEEIANQLDIKTTGIDQANVVYFNSDFTVLYLRYGGAFTGSAGSTNVIVDFQEDQQNPTLHLVDLGLQ